MNIINNNHFIVEKTVIKSSDDCKAGIIDFNRKSILVIKDNTQFNYDKIVHFLLKNSKLEGELNWPRCVMASITAFEIYSLNRIVIVSGWSISKRGDIAYSFFFSLNIPDYPEIMEKKDFNINFVKLKNFGVPTNNTLSTQFYPSLTNTSINMFLCMTVTSMYHIKYLKR